VADHVVAMLKNREDASGFIRLDQRPRFNIGDQVRVLEGVFNASIGIYDGMPERDRIAILLDLLGRKVRVIVHPEAVAAA
jgi:transcriptional antiterminator RfaH